MKQTLANEPSDSRQADRPTESREENEEGGHGGRQRDQMPKDGKRDGDGAGMEEGGGGRKRSLWQDTQTCACQNKTPRSMRRKFARKTKRRGAQT